MNDYAQVLRILDAIKGAKGNDKLPLLTKYLDTNPLFVKVVQYALDSRKVYHCTKVTFTKHSLAEDVFKHLDFLDSKTGANKWDKDMLNRIASESSEKFEVVSRILKRSLSCGVDVKTIHNLRPGIVPYFPYMRCSTLDQIGNIVFPCYSQLKADGMYFDVFCNREITFQTRNGKIAQFPGIDTSKFPVFEGKLMGEALLLNPNKTGFMRRKDGNAIINKAQYGLMSREEVSRLRFSFWDCFQESRSDKVYGYRMSALQRMGVTIIESRIVNNMEEAWEHYDDVRERDLEGTVLKNFDSPHIDGTSTHNIKVKAEKECELLVVGIVPGKGKYEGMIGALECSSSCGQLLTDVGMGLSDEDRKRDDWIGQIITVRFNEVSKSKAKDTYALTHARLMEVRQDKGKADDLGYIQNVKEVKRRK